MLLKNPKQNKNNETNYRQSGNSDNNLNLTMNLRAQVEETNVKLSPPQSDVNIITRSEEARLQKWLNYRDLPRIDAFIRTTGYRYDWDTKIIATFVKSEIKHRLRTILVLSVVPIYEFFYPMKFQVNSQLG